MYTVPDMSGRVCMITGPNSGIGKATAQQLAGGGAHVFVASRPAGRYEVTFRGEGFLSGLYIYRLETAGFTESRKMMLVK